MSNQELVDALVESRASRRNVLKSAIAGSMALAGAAMLPGCGGSGKSSSSGAVAPTDMLQFALNLEYLEAQYYSYGVTGLGIDAGVGGDVPPTAPAKVTFSKYGSLASDIATDELNHVAFLKSVINASGVAAVGRPPIDLLNSFNAAAVASGLGASFNPFANELNFLLGAFIFEDVGVTAYLGGIQYLQNTGYLTPAAGILGVEAYHAGAIRYALAEAGQASAVKQISTLRGTADGSGSDSAGNVGHEHPLDPSGQVATSADDANSLGFARTPQEVLNIVYLNATPSTVVHAGGFFPSGLNGLIR